MDQWKGLVGQVLLELTQGTAFERNMAMLEGLTSSLVADELEASGTAARRQRRRRRRRRGCSSVSQQVPKVLMR